MSELEKKFLSILQAAVQNKSSDVHLMTGQPAALRASGGLVAVNLPAFTLEEIQAVCSLMISDPKIKAQVATLQDLDGSFEVKGLGRFRFNIYRTTSGMGAVLRVIPSAIPSIDDLKLPSVLRKIASANRGLILVTGATGSGKSSTLAAMIDHINSNESLHILTVEDPVEYLHPQKKSRLSQREIGRDTTSFAQALKSALRQDPDVILVGEMRDYETLDIALKAAETGHLVFSTVHTSDAMKTIGRLISLFPSAEQNIARTRLADNMQAIICQRLVPGKAGGKVVAQEIMINNAGIAECIANEKKTSDIPNFIEKGKEVSGMQTFDQHLADLALADKITIDTALEYASNPADFQRNLSFGSSALGDGASNLPTLGIETPEEIKPEEAAPPAGSAAAALAATLPLGGSTPPHGIAPPAGMPRPGLAPPPAPGMAGMPRPGLAGAPPAPGAAKPAVPPPAAGTFPKIPKIPA
jgi:twitching motility protein PilT